MRSYSDHGDVTVTSVTVRVLTQYYLPVPPASAQDSLPVYQCYHQYWESDHSQVEFPPHTPEAEVEIFWSGISVYTILLHCISAWAQSSV